VVLLIAALVLAAHGGALRGAFHYDDLFTVVGNPAVRSWSLVRAFASTEAVTSERGDGSYRPMTVASLALNHRVSGLDPWGYLATNLALHLLAALLVTAVARELFDSLRWAGAAGVVFALHPVNAEAVNYVTARSSLLSTVFALAAAWAFLREVHGRGAAGTRAAGLVAFLCALLSKESAVALVIPLLAYPWFRARPGPAPVARPIAAYVVLAALFVVGYRWFIRPAGFTAIEPASRPVWTYLEMVGRSMALWVWPWPLGLDHPLTFLSGFDWGVAIVLVVGLAACGVAIVRSRRRAPAAGWGLVWGLAGFVPLAPLPWLTTLSLLQENRIAFSSAGLAWTTVAAARLLWGAVARRGAGTVTRWSCAGVLAAGCVLAIGVDRSRSVVWQDDRLLWAEVVRWAPDNAVARINLGAAHMEAGDLDRAEAEFRGLLAEAPGYPRASYNLGLIALRRGRSDEAAAAFRQVLAVAESSGARAHLGILALRAGDLEEATRQFDEALRIDPHQQESLVNRSSIALSRGAWSDALDLADRALAGDPGILEAAYNRAVALAALGRREEAAASLQAVRERLPPGAAFDPFRSGIDRLLAGETP
jgi:tetratricopeptide (TPR) repeat protein